MAYAWLCVSNRWFLKCVVDCNNSTLLRILLQEHRFLAEYVKNVS